MDLKLPIFRLGHEFETAAFVGLARDEANALVPLTATCRWVRLSADRLERWRSLHRRIAEWMAARRAERKTHTEVCEQLAERLVSAVEGADGVSRKDLVLGVQGMLLDSADAFASWPVAEEEVPLTPDELVEMSRHLAATMTTCGDVALPPRSERDAEALALQFRTELRRNDLAQMWLVWFTAQEATPAGKPQPGTPQASSTP